MNHNINDKHDDFVKLTINAIRDIALNSRININTMYSEPTYKFSVHTAHDLFFIVFRPIAHQVIVERSNLKNPKRIIHRFNYADPNLVDNIIKTISRISN